MNVMTWEWTIARPMLLLHALTGCAAVGISIHVLYFIWRGASGRNPSYRSRARRYAAITWPLYLAAMVTGALVYPAYKVGVRAAWMDVNRPALTGLFEIKEHWAALGTFLAWSAWRFLRRPKTAPAISPVPKSFRGQAVITAIMVICALVNVIIGTWIVMVRSV